MKKIITIAVAVVLVIALFAVVAPVGAKGPPPPAERTVFETGLVPQLQNVPNVGTYSSVTLEEGEVKVCADGGWKVEIEGLELNGELYTGELVVRVWDIDFIGGKWQRGDTAAVPATISLEDGEGKLEIQGGDGGSIFADGHSGFFVRVNDPGVAWLLMSGFSIE